jgi:maltodextrin utilization protein YvdJ
MHLILTGILLVCAIGASVLLMSFVIDIVHIIQLTRKGKFVEFESKKDMVNTALNALKTSDEKSKTRSVG